MKLVTGQDRWGVGTILEIPKGEYILTGSQVKGEIVAMLGDVIWLNSARHLNPRAHMKQDLFEQGWRKVKPEIDKRKYSETDSQLSDACLSYDAGRCSKQLFIPSQNGLDCPKDCKGFGNKEILITEKELHQRWEDFKKTFDMNDPEDKRYGSKSSEKALKRKMEEWIKDFDKRNPEYLKETAKILDKEIKSMEFTTPFDSSEDESQQETKQEIINEYLESQPKTDEMTPKEFINYCAYYESPLNGGDYIISVRGINSKMIGNGINSITIKAENGL